MVSCFVIVILRRQLKSPLPPPGEEGGLRPLALFNFDQHSNYCVTLQLAERVFCQKGLTVLSHVVRATCVISYPLNRPQQSRQQLSQ